jgi:hypothetical protein
MTRRNTTPRNTHHLMRMCKSTRLLILNGLMIACAALVAFSVTAQTCIPRAIGVPGQSSAPNWFDAGQPPGSATRFNDSLDDPRWRGAVNQTYGNGTAEQVSFRALHSTVLGQESLYLSWFVKVSPSLQPVVNQVFVGFSPGGGQDDVILNAQLNNSAPGNATTNITRAVLTKPAASPGTAYTGVGEPAWFPQRTRAWVDNSGGAGMGKWAIQMVVPISNAGLASGINLTSPFKMWFEVDVSVNPGDSSFVTYRFPVPANQSDPASPPQVHDVDIGTGNDRYPETSTWGTLRLTNGTADSPDPNCPVDGVSLRVGDIGTTNNPTSQMNLNSTNTFVARARNNTGSSIGDGQLLASFFLANWGTQILVDDPADPAGPWTPIAGLQDVASSGATANGGQANIQRNKTFNATEKAPFINGTKNLHQCILVKLRALTTVKFTNDSTARNMDFVNASRFERDADVSVVGLPDMAGSPRRDVYLYLEVANMPAVVQGGGGGGQGTPGVARAAATGRGTITGELDPVIPTYRVHGYHDTGKRITRNSVTSKVFSAQSSFGYYVNHSGPLEGWKYAIEGAQKITDNLYLIAVPNKSAAKIKTIIEAVEPGGNVGSGFKHWGLSLHSGISIPHGGLNSSFNVGPNIGADLEYRFNRTFSLEGIYTLHHFPGETFGTFTIPDLNVHQVSVNGKVYGPSSPIRPFFNFGGGSYTFAFSGGSSTRGGINVGGGLQFDATPNVAFDVMYNFHNVFTSGSNTHFSSVQGGVRFRF